MRLPPFNLVNVAPVDLVSTKFNERPVDLFIHGTREAHAALFSRLAGLDAPAERVDCFHRYLAQAFRLDEKAGKETPSGRLSFTLSYLRFLLGWLFDSNSAAGAVWKSWVESRFGLPPTFHRVPLESLKDEGYRRYLADRAQGMAFTGDIEPQFDLLYEFTQEELRRTGTPDHLILFRGVRALAEHRVAPSEGEGLRLWLNNLNSFTRDFERAWEFGDRVLEARIPRPKVVFDGALLNGGFLQGENEVLVLGGQYDVLVHRF